MWGVHGEVGVARLCLPMAICSPVAPRQFAQWSRPILFAAHGSGDGPSVRTGRALQAESDDLEVVGLALLYPALDGTFEFLAIMDIRARSVSSATRPRRP